MKNKIKNRKIKLNNLDTKLIYILAFLLPICIICGYVVVKEIIFEGDFFSSGENFLVADMHQQYVSIYSYIWEILHGNASLVYSFSKDLGGEMLTTIGYYGASPINIIFLFIRKTDMPVAVFVMYCIKIGLCSLFSLIFFNYKFGKNKSNLLFSLLYAFCGYCVAYYFHLMWLDVVYMAPLVMMGIEKLIKGKPLQYIVTLSLAIIFNFYIGYMLCIFSLIYFLYELFINYHIKEFKKYKKNILIYIISSILSVGISFVVILPIINGLSHVSRVNMLVGKTNYIIYKDFFDAVLNNFIKQFRFPGYDYNDILQYYPKLYTGLITILLTYLYFVNKKINRKEKILSFIVIIIFLLSLTISPIFKIWHGFIYPCGYAGRYTFLLSLFLIILSIKSYKNLCKINIKKYIFFIILIFVLNFYFYHNEIYHVKKYYYSVTFILLSFYSVCIYLYTIIKNINIKNIVKYLMYFVIIIELIINYSYGMITKIETNEIGQYSYYLDRVCPRFNSQSTNFYRISGGRIYGQLDSMLCNYNSTSSFITTNDKNYIKFWKNIGEAASTMGTYYNTNRLPILDSILGIKYVYDNNNNLNSYYKAVDNISYSDASDIYRKGIYIFNNEYALNLGYLIPEDYNKNYLRGNYKNSFEFLNEIVKAFSENDKDILIEYKRKYLKNNKYIFDINNNEPYIYFAFDYYPIETVEGSSSSDVIAINDFIGYPTRMSNLGMLRVDNDYFDKKMKVSVLKSGLKNTKNGSLYAYWFDLDEFKNSIDMLKKRQLKNIVVNKNKVSGDVKVLKDSILFMSIPYDTNWNVYVDGKKTSYKKVIDEFIGIPIQKGNHHIKMEYKSKPLKYGIIISVFSIILTFAMILFIKKRGTNEK